VGLFEANVTWFDQRFSNMIQYVSRPAPATSYDNLARAAARGLEVSWQLASARPSPLILGGGWTWLSTEVLDGGTGAGGTFATGQRLLRRPKVQASINIGWQVAGLGTVQLNAQHVGQRDDRDFNAFPSVGVVLPSYRRYDLAIDVPLFAQAATRTLPGLTVRVENLGNATYENVYGFPSPGRAVLVGMRTAVRF
jgi:outer membrane cobalamin receptor